MLTAEEQDRALRRVAMLRNGVARMIHMAQNAQTFGVRSIYIEQIVDEGRRLLDAAYAYGVAAELSGLEGARRVDTQPDQHQPLTPAPHPQPVQLGSQGDSAHTPKGGNE